MLLGRSNSYPYVRIRGFRAFGSIYTLGGNVLCLWYKSWFMTGFGSSRRMDCVRPSVEGDQTGSGRHRDFVCAFWLTFPETISRGRDGRARACSRALRRRGRMRGMCRSPPSLGVLYAAAPQRTPRLFPPASITSTSSITFCAQETLSAIHRPLQ